MMTIRFLRWEDVDPAGHVLDPARPRAIERLAGASSIAAIEKVAAALLPLFVIARSANDARGACCLAYVVDRLRGRI